jgi:hypothetical protein
MADTGLPSLGDTIAMVTALLTGGATYGTLSQRIKSLEKTSDSEIKRNEDRDRDHQELSNRLTRIEVGQQNIQQLLSEVRSAVLSRNGFTSK